MKNCSSSEAVYGLGVIGAAIYFFQNVSGLGPVLLALGKALVWPALLVYQAMSLLKM